MRKLEFQNLRGDDNIVRMTQEQILTVAALIGLALLTGFLWILWRKGRPFAAGDVFQASRLSRSNRVFPTQVLITPTSVVQFKPRLIGKQEESIHLAHVSSVKVETRLFLSDVSIETSGGSNPIRCHGHTKGDAIRMKTLIEQYQTNYYKGGVPPRP